MKDDDDDKEWKSSHDRFVEALERMIDKQDRLSMGFVCEVKREELEMHFKERADHYRAEAQLLIKSGPSEAKQMHAMLAEKQLRLRKARIDQKHKMMIEVMNARAKAFAFAAKHMPEGKQVFVMSMSECAAFELIPHERQMAGIG